MYESIMALFIMSAAASIVCILAPPDQKGIKYIAGLCVIISLLLPVSELISELRSGDIPGITDYGDSTGNSGSDGKYSEILRSGLESVSRENVRDGVISIMSTKFGVDPAECDVIVDLVSDESSVKLEKITILLRGAAIWKDPHEISSYFEELLGCRCAVAIV